MKKLITLALALLLGVTAALAAAEGWNPGQPYEGVPPIDLAEQLGYMLFYPNADMAPEALCDRLYVYLPRDDAQPGDGALLLFTDGAEAWRTPMTAPCVTARPLTADEQDSLLWQSGTCFEIVLPRSLTLGQTYVVNMERGAIVAGEVTNAQIGGADAWTFTLAGDYGLSAIEYRRPAATGDEGLILAPQPGDQLRFDLVLGGDAVAAALYSDGSVTFQPSYFTDSGEVTGTVTGDAPSWGVIFLDADGNPLTRADF